MNPAAQARRFSLNSWVPGKRPPFDLAKHRKQNPDVIEGEFWELLEDVWEYTCVSVPALYNLYTACRYITEKGVAGDVIECGVLYGGSIMMAAHTLSRCGGLDERRVVAVDTFRGFVRRSDNDIDFEGKDVCHPGKGKNDWFKQAEANIRSVPCDQSRVDIVQGDVLKVLVPTIKDRRIAILRLDTDTYDTTKHELEVSWDHLSPGGVVIIDDYGWCHGARDATDEFIADKKVFLTRVNNWTRCFVKM